MKLIEQLNLVELNEVQEQTIKQSFNAEYLKDEISFSKQFDYDFDDLEDDE
jgi:hypothetical protein